MKDFIIIAGTITRDGWKDVVFKTQAEDQHEAVAKLDLCDYIPMFAIELPEGRVFYLNLRTAEPAEMLPLT